MTVSVRTRFAPSPSGHLHVGGARTALFCWAYARGRDGRFLLRIEDTDQKRSSDAAGMAFLEDLAWLGINWDEGPEHAGLGGGTGGPDRQSQRLELYQQHIDALIETGAAYRAFDTPEQLDEARTRARAEKRDYRYDRAALALDETTVREWLDEGRPYVVRFKMPDDKQIVVHDEVLGDVVTAAGTLDDFVIQKADGYPTYHFAVVLDDELMGVTHVIRGQEHLNNTAKHVALQDAMGFGRPVYAHLSLIFNTDGSKMSKRDKDKALRAAAKARPIEDPPIDVSRWSWWLDSADHQLDPAEAGLVAAALNIELPEIDVDDFRRAGYLPEVLVNYLALLGWSPGGDLETFDRDFLVANFDFDRIVKSPAKFDRDKLLAFNLDAIQAMSAQAFQDRYREHCRAFHPEFLERLSPEAFDMLAAANHPRAKTLQDTIESSRFFVVDDDAVTLQDTKAVRKALGGGPPSGRDRLTALLPVLETIDQWTPAALETALSAYAEAHTDGKLGKIAQPLRVAVSGNTVSPAIFETLAILGKASVLNRIRRCLDG
jgi:glutamyl-tRNA synthetase